MTESNYGTIPQLHTLVMNTLYTRGGHIGFRFGLFGFQFGFQLNRVRELNPIGLKTLTRTEPNLI